MSKQENDASVAVEGATGEAKTKHFSIVQEQEQPFRSSGEKVTESGSSNGEGLGEENGLHDGVEYRNGHPVIRNGKFPKIVVYALRQRGAHWLIRKKIGDDVSRFVVSDRDDGDPALTFRSVFLGTIFTALSSVITMLYVFKPTSMQVSAVFLQRE